MLLVDSSNNNRHPINWSQAHQAGVTHAYMKVSEGVTFTDGYYRPDRRAAQQAGIEVGGYHFLKHGDLGAQATHFLAALDDPTNQLRAVIDAETAGLTADDVLTFGGALEAVLGYVPVLYTYSAFLAGELRNDPRLSRFPLWIANYRSTPPTTPWPWAAWQSTSAAQVNGFTSRVDLSHIARPAQLARVATPPIPSKPKGPTSMFVTQSAKGVGYLVLDKGKTALANASEYAGLKAAGVAEVKLSDATLDGIAVAQ